MALLLQQLEELMLVRDHDRVTLRRCVDASRAKIFQQIIVTSEDRDSRDMHNDPYHIA